jgi:hypothetical protein
MVNDSAVITITVLNELEVNRALNKPVYASSYETYMGNSFVPDMAVDGNTSTRWGSKYDGLSDAVADSQWIYIDLLGFYDIAQVVLNWETAYGESYLIQVSDDAASWTTIHSVTGSDGNIDSLTGLSGVGRFVRMKGVNRATQWGYSLYEFEVYGYPQKDIVVTHYKDNFNDDILTGWRADHPRTFGLSESDGVLNINYTRTDSSEMWDNFNLTPIGKVDASDYPYITVDIKSTVSTQVTFKPIYAFSPDTSDWLQKNVPGDSTWRTYTFNLSGYASTKSILMIYMYLDGGSTDIKSGKVHFDNLYIGADPTSVDRPANEIPAK